MYFQSVRIGADEDIDDFKGMSKDEVNEVLEDKEAKANAQILEMVMLHLLCINIHCMQVFPVALIFLEKVVV